METIAGVAGADGVAGAGRVKGSGGGKGQSAAKRQPNRKRQNHGRTECAVVKSNGLEGASPSGLAGNCRSLERKN